MVEGGISVCTHGNHDELEDILLTENQGKSKGGKGDVVRQAEPGYVAARSKYLEVVADQTLPLDLTERFTICMEKQSLIC